MATHDEISRIIRGENGLQRILPTASDTGGYDSISEIIRGGSAAPLPQAQPSLAPSPQSLPPMGTVATLIAQQKPELVRPTQQTPARLLSARFVQGLTGGLVTPETFGVTKQPETTLEKIGATAAEMAGWAAPIGALAKVTAPVATAIRGVQALGRTAPAVGRIAQWGTAGALAAVPEQARELSAGKPVGEAAKEIGEQAAIWAGMEAAGLALSPLLRRVARRLTPRVQEPMPVTATTERPLLALPLPGARYEAGTRQVISPRRFHLETGEERLSRIIETIRPEAERQRQQAVRVRQLLGEAGAPPTESKKVAVEFLSRSVPEVPKSTWRSMDMQQLTNMVNAIAEGARILPGGLEPIATRVARSMGYDFRREFEIANLPAADRLRAMAANNHWRMILGLQDVPALREPPRVPQAYVRPIEPISGSAQLTTPGVQRIARPETPEWEAAVLRTPENQVKATAEAARVAGSVAQHATAPSPPKVVAAAYRSPEEKTEFWRRAFSSVEGWLKSKGEPGQRMVTMAREVERIADQQVERWTRDTLAKVARLTPQERLNMRDVVRGQAQPMNQNVADADQAVRTYYAERPARIQQAGLTLRTKGGQDIPFVPSENHFPLRLDWRKLSRPREYDNALEYLVKTGQAKDLGEADRLLRVLRRTPLERHATFQYEAERISLPQYEVDPLVALRSDVAEAENRIAQALVYGSRDERLLEAVEQMAPGDRHHAGTVANILRGLDATDLYWRNVVDGLLSYNVLSKMGLSAIPNTTQTINAALKLGVKQLVRGIQMAVANKQEAIEFAQRAGIHLDPANIARAISEARGEFWPAMTSRFLRATGFNATEFWNRLITSQAAKGWAEDVFQALKQPGSVSWVRRAARTVGGTQPMRIRRLLAEAGVDVDAALQRGALSEDDLHRVVRWAVERTQFPAGKLDVPFWASSPWGRLVFQFKRYAFNQGRLLQRELVDEAGRFFRTGGKDGSLRAWGPFLVLFPTAGWLVSAIRDWVSGKETPAEKMQRISEAIWERGPAAALIEEMARAYMWVGGLGIVSDIIRQLQYGEERILSTLLGPSSTLVTDIGAVARQAMTAAQRTWEGEPVEPEQRLRQAIRAIIRNVPVVGPSLARGQMPFVPAPER